MTYKLLSNPTDNPKVAKNIGFGVLTAPLHLAPANLSGYEVCPMRSLGCTAACLHTAGNPAYMKGKNAARIRKTKMYFEERDLFMAQLYADIEKLQKTALSRGLTCGVRLNATSDIPWERVLHNGKTLMEWFPKVKFMDYTKRHNRKDLPSNYKLVYSRAEDNDDRCLEAMRNGMNVAVVFGKKPLPDTFFGKKVVDGDEHDWRWHEYETYPNERVVIGLKAKGKGKEDTSGFVVY